MKSNTAIPSQENQGTPMSEVMQRDEAYIAHTYSRFPIEITGGHGSVVTDRCGKEYIDLGTGIAVNIFGVCDAEWTKAVTAQLGAFQHTSNLYYSAPQTVLAEMLCNRTGMKRVFFSNSGAEANECAIKAARKWAADNKGSEYATIITLKNSFHGRTITTLAATGQDAFHHDFLPLTPGFVYATANDLADVKRLAEENSVAAVMFECVQGEGGVIPLEKEFVQGIFDLAAEQNFLTIADEVQTGNGRSGSLYAYMQYGVLPDIVTTAKGLGGGLPLGATLLGERVSEVYAPGQHGSTFGGNPVCAAGAVSILSRLDDACLSGVRERSTYLIETLRHAKGMKSVSGMGLMLGLETEKDAGAVVNALMAEGVLVLKAKNKVRLLPALNIPMALLKQATEKICAVCAG